MKRIFLAFILFFTAFLIISPAVLAQGRIGTGNRIREEVRQWKQSGLSPTEIKNEKKALLEEIKDKVKKFRFAARVSGEILAINSNIFTIKGNDSKNYQANVTDKTQLRRRFWGKSQLSEFSVGDKVNVIGRWTDENKNIIDAVLIRNLSIQKRWGVFFGDIQSKTDDSFVLKTSARGNQTVNVGATTKYVNRKEETIGYGDLQVGHRLRVKGIWDRTLNTINEVDQIKDFSLPPIPTKAISPTGSQ